MHKIFVIMGKSATGKDTIFKYLISLKELPLKTAVGYTTRPIRVDEADGVEYFFINEEKMKQMEAEGRIIESRCYQTVLGDWHYFTADDGQIDLALHDYLLILTPEGFLKLKSFYGENTVMPVYVETEDEERLLRAIRRMRKQKSPNYSEVCRRYLADEADFSEENIKRLGIAKRYLNRDVNICIHQIMEDIKKML